MSTPQGPGQSPDHPSDQPEWGKGPAGGWGGPQHREDPADIDNDRTRPVTKEDVAAAAERHKRPDQPQPPAGPQGDQRHGEQPAAGAQPGWGAPPAGQQYGGQPQGGYGDQQYGGYGQPTQQGGQYGQPQYPNQQGWGAQQGAQQYGGQPQYPNQYGQPQYPNQQQGWGGQDQQAWGAQPGQQPAWGAQGQATQHWPGADQQQQWGAGNYPPLPDTSARSGGRSKLPLIIGAAIVVVAAIVGVLGFWMPGFFVTRVFDTAALQSGVQQVLQTDYGLAVDSVTCGDKIQVTNGATFQCDATIDGQPQKVDVKVTSATGDYQVARPAG